MVIGDVIMIIQGKKFSDGVVCIGVDYTKSERTEAGGCFQICDIR